MSTQITLEYLSKLLNKPVTEQIEIALSSAQKSRVHGWLIKNGISFNESAFAGKFTVNELLLGDIRKEAPKPHSQGGVSSPIQLDMDNFQIGIDIQRVDELFPRGLSFDPKVDQGLNHIYTAKELSYAQSKKDAEVTLSGIFCAKEAIQKASNLTKNLNEIEVLPDLNGRPKYNGYALSIAHSSNYAIAIAIAKIEIKPLNRVNDGLMLNQVSKIQDESKFSWHQSLAMSFAVILTVINILFFFMMDRVQILWR